MEAAALRCGDGQINYRQSVAARPRGANCFATLMEWLLAGARKRRSRRCIGVVELAALI